MNIAFSPKKVLNSVFAVALAATMMPVQALASAPDDVGEEHAQLAEDRRYSEVKTLTKADEPAEQPAADQAPEPDAPEAPAAPQEPAAQPEEQLAPQVAPAAADPADAADEEDVEMLRAGVAIGDQPATLTTIGGLTFSLNPEKGTAALVGFGHAPQGELAIPQTVSATGTEYTVTNICTLRGGVFANCRIWR